MMQMANNMAKPEVSKDDNIRENGVGKASENGYYVYFAFYGIQRRLRASERISYPDKQACLPKQISCFRLGSKSQQGENHEASSYDH